MGNTPGQGLPCIDCGLFPGANRRGGLCDSCFPYKSQYTPRPRRRRPGRIPLAWKIRGGIPARQC